MEGQTVDSLALDAAISHWLHRIGTDGIEMKPCGTEDGGPAYSNAIDILMAHSVPESRDLMGTVDATTAFRLAWFLALDCACAVIADPLGDPRPTMLMELDTTREELEGVVAEIEARRSGSKVRKNNAA